MSTVDQRVVDMQFNNQQFERGVSQSVRSLEDLRRGLDLEGATRSLTNLDRAGRSFSLEGIAAGVDAIAARFTTLGVVGMSVINNLTNKVMDFAHNLTTALTTELPVQGYGDYIRKLTSVQTIMNATGKSIKNVSVYFDQLDEYADKTIYNLDHMTSALAKFTNAGVSLDKSVPAIKGIANMVALAGQDANAAGIAFYNLSQSIAGGYLTTLDFKSLSLANVATKEWKQHMADGAVAAGTLTKEVNGLYKIISSGAVVNMQDLFNKELSTGWATTKVMMNVLGKYGDTTTDIGKKAQAAAQDVKDFGMMVDTLKASIGTGWTDTFEIILGNLLEAKALFTPLTKAISDTVERSTEARNSILSFWKAAGGRNDLIQSIANALEGLASILAPIEQAFRDIFPPLTGQTLVDLTKKLKDFTAGFKIGEEASKNLRRTFKGLFALLDIGKEIIFAVTRGILSLINYLNPAGNSVLAFTGDIGDFIVAIRDALKASDIFNGTIKKFGEVLKPIADVLQNVIQKVASLLSKLFSPNDMGFDKIAGWVGNLISKFSAIPNVIAGILDGIIQSITTALKNNDLNGVIGVINTGVFATLLLGIKNFIERFKGMSTEGFMVKFKGILDGVRDSLSQLQATLRVGILLGIASAIAILAGSIMLISSIDPKRLESSLGAVTLMLMELFGSMLIFEKLMSGVGFAAMGRITLAMIGLSTAVLVLSAAMTVLSKLDWKGITKGLVAIASLSGILVGASKLLSGASKGLISTSFGFIVLGGAILILSSAVEKLGSMNLVDLTKGLVSVGVVAATLSLFLKATDLSGGGLIASAGLVALSVAIGILSLAVSKFALLDVKSLVKGLGSVAILLTEVGVFSTFTAGGANILIAATSLVILGGAMIIFSKAIKMISNIAWSNIAKGMVSMAGALTIIGVASALFPANMILMGAGLVVVSGALMLLSNSLVGLGSMSWEAVAKSLISLAGALTIVTVAMSFMSGTIPGLVSLVLVVTSLETFADIMTTIGSLPLKNVAVALLAIAGVFGVIGVAGLALAPISPVILELSGTIAIFGLSLLTVSANILVFTASISLLIASISFGVLVTTIFIATVSSMAGSIPYILDNLVTGLLNAIAKIANGFDIIMDGLAKILDGIAEFIVKMTPKILASIAKVLIKVIEVISEFAPKLIEVAIDLVLALFKGLTDNMQDIVTLGSDLIIAFLKGMESKIGDIIQAGIDFMIKLIEGMTRGLNENTDRIITAVDNLVKAIIDAQVKTVYDLAPSIGKNIVTGMIRGMGMLLEDAKNTASDLGKSVLESAKKSLGIHSPSKLFKDIGNNIVAGLTKGISDNSKEAEKASEDMSDNMVASAGKAAKKTRTKANDEAKKAFDASSSWIDERKYYNQLSLSEELAAWERVQKKFIAGSEERKKADREVYRVKKELIKEAEDIEKKKFDNSKKWIEEEKYYNRLSLRDELAAQERIAAAHKNNADITNQTNREIYRLKKDIEKADEEYFAKWINESNEKERSEAEQTYAVLTGLIEDKRYYNKITLVEELELLREVGKVDKLTASDRKQNAREIYRLEQEIANKTKSATEKIESEKKKANDERIKMEDEYYNKVKEINEKLKKDSDDLVKKYNDALDSRTKALYSTYGLFDKVDKKDPINGSELIDNLKGQVNEIQTWRQQLDQLSKKGIDLNLLSELEGLGPKSLQQITALNSLSESELREYTRLWQSKHEVVKQQAVKELEGLRIETGKQLVELQKKSEEDLTTLKTTYDGKIKEIKDNAVKEITALKDEWIKEVGILKTDTELKFTKMAEGIQSTLETPEWQTIGGNIVSGITAGVKSQAAILAAETAEVARQALQSAKDALGIKSPSKEFAKVGRYSIDGFVSGIKNFSGNVVDAMSSFGNTAIDTLRNTISNIGDAVNGDMNLVPVIRPVIDLTDVKAGTDKINGLLTNKQGINVSSINAKIPTMSQTKPVENIVNQPSAGSSVQFVQNNYSPTPLSRLEIYRQTKNQISTLKGLVRTV